MRLRFILTAPHDSFNQLIRRQGQQTAINRQLPISAAMSTSLRRRCKLTFPTEDSRRSCGALLVRLADVCPPRCWDLVYGESVGSSAAGCLESSAPVEAMSPPAWDQRSQPRCSKVKSWPARCGTPCWKIGSATSGPRSMTSRNCRRKFPRSSGTPRVCS